MTETQRNIEQYKALLPGLKERVMAAAMLMVVSLSMVVSASFAWYTLSVAPEVSMINTTLAANGNLEIALVGRLDEDGNALPPEDSKAGDSSAATSQTLVGSNITWGNLVNLSDHSYGLSEISLRPALLSGYNRTKTPLYGATYSSDGRIVDVSQTYEYATWTQLDEDDYYFAAGEDSTYGVRAIASVTYSNVTGNAAMEKMQKDITKAYFDANEAYVNIITGVTKVSTDPEVSCMDALQQLLEIYVNEKAENAVTSGTYIYYDYSGVVTYTYRLIQEFEKVLLLEGKALLNMANLQMYLNDETNTVGTEYFKSLDELIAAYDSGELTTLGVQLESMPTYVNNRKALTDAMTKPPASGQKTLAELAVLYDPSPDNTSRPTETVKWSQISKSLDKLVVVDSTEINGTKMSSFDANHLGEVLDILNAKSHKVVIKEGTLKETEQRLGDHLLKKDVRMSIYIKPVVNKTISNVLVTTDAADPFLSNNDQGYTFGLEASGNSGDATAQDTYGMAIDLWLRTNMAGTNLILEGSTVYNEIDAVCTDKNGNETTLYTADRPEESIDVYYMMETATQATKNWYNASTHELIGSDEELKANGYTITEQKDKTVKDKNGAQAALYTVANTTGGISVDAYFLNEKLAVKNWYNAETNELLGSDLEMTENGYGMSPKQVEVTCTDKNGKKATVYLATKDDTTIEVYQLEETIGGNPLTNWYAVADDTLMGTNSEMTANGYTMTVKMTGVSDTDQNGSPVTVYTAVRSVSSIDVYRLEEKVNGATVENWYNATTHTLMGTTEELTEQDYFMIVKKRKVVEGYEGTNRVWVDWKDLIEAGYMPEEDSTTQGSGSCYVFYADPSDQTRILKLLEAFTVAFLDQEGNTLGTARLNTADAYAINGKVTVPLKVVSGLTYEDEEGNEQVAITALEQNKETWITAIVYLDGMMLTNEQVLSAGEIEGRLNLQFGSSDSLDAIDDKDLQKKYRTITAVAESDGQTSTKDTERISYEYDGVTKKITVTLTVDGDQPNNLTGFFTRAISQNQGSKMPSVEFTDNKNGTWSAVFDLTKPGLYSLRTVIADGVEYDLNEHPTVYIEGLKILSIICRGYQSGLIMSADSYIDIPVEAEIAATAELMPKNVRALFRGEDGKEYTALMAYDEIAKKWVGTARIASSGTFTLEDLVMDGDANRIEATQQVTLITKLGLKAYVQCTNLDEIPMEFTGPVDVDVQVRLVDDSDAEIREQKNIWLFYHSANSTTDQDGMRGEIKWNASTGYYEGTMTMNTAGTYSFNRIAVTNNGVTSVIRQASAPTFTVMPSDPPVYLGFTENRYQFTTAGKARVSVELENAETAKIWAVIKNVNRDQTTLVACPTDPAYRVGTTYYFDVPTNVADPYAGKQDGVWVVQAIAMQNVYIKEQNKLYGATAEAPTADNYTENCYVIDVYNENDPYDATKDTQTNNFTYVVQTVNVAITKTDVAGEYPGTNYGGTDSEKTGAFMQQYTESGITITIKDWNDQALKGISDVGMVVKYDGLSKANGGYYSGTNANGVANSTTAWSVSGSGTTYTAANQVFQLAGGYKVDVVYKVDGNDYSSPEKLKYNVYSKMPTVEITNTTTYGDSTSNATSATVYFNVSKSTNCGITTTNYSQPTVTIKLTGYGSANGNATLTFSKAGGAEVHLYAESTKNSTPQLNSYTWTGDTECTRWVGYWGYVSGGSDSKEPAGEMKATELVIAHGTESYTFDIPDITINNPD